MSKNHLIRNFLRNGRVRVNEGISVIGNSSMKCKKVIAESLRFSDRSWKFEGLRMGPRCTIFRKLARNRKRWSKRQSFYLNNKNNTWIFSLTRKVYDFFFETFYKYLKVSCSMKNMKVLFSEGYLTPNLLLETFDGRPLFLLSHGRVGARNIR